MLYKNPPHILFILLLAGSILVSCKTTSIMGPSYKSPDKYNLKFIGYDDSNIAPDKAKRSFYKISINKVINGRTTTGLEFQKKTYTTKLSLNRHVLTVKKYVLDERTKQYKLLNNINQPKPGFIVFTMPEDRIVLITMSVEKNNKAKYKVGFEMKK